jgi:hypothetical protein
MDRITLVNEIRAIIANPDMTVEELAKNKFIKDKLSVEFWLNRIKRSNPMNCGHGEGLDCTLCY